MGYGYPFDGAYHFNSKHLSALYGAGAGKPLAFGEMIPVDRPNDVVKDRVVQKPRRFTDFKRLCVTSAGPFAFLRRLMRHQPQTDSGPMSIPSDLGGSVNVSGIFYHVVQEKPPLDSLQYVVFGSEFTNLSMAWRLRASYSELPLYISTASKDLASASVSCFFCTFS